MHQIDSQDSSDSDDSSDDESSDKKRRQLTDEEIFKACGGLTAHKLVFL
jgi:hypothetical protein